MEQEELIFSVLILSPILLCIATAAVQVRDVSNNSVLRVLVAIVCLFPGIAATNNVVNLFGHHLEAALFYTAPVLLLISMLIGVIAKINLRHKKIFVIMTTLSALASGGLALFVHLLWQL